MTKGLAGHPVIEVANQEDLAAWLEEQDETTCSHWLVHGKKNAGESYLPYDTMVRTLLSHGWIDSLPRRVDDTRTAHLISPRKPGSVWSLDNRERVAELEARGLMTERGKRIVEAARHDGSWDLLKPTETGEAPSDLTSALEAKQALDEWQKLSLATRRRALEALVLARKAETRQKRIKRIVEACAAGEDPTRWQPRS